MNKLVKGLFIVFEGLDGSGKSTQARLLNSALEKAGYQSRFTMEPTGDALGKMIRTSLKGEILMSEELVASLFASDRINHLEESGGILEAVANGEIVVCDRYVWSSYAYNCPSRNDNWVESLNLHARKIGVPDLIFYLDISPTDALKRIEERGEEKEAFENIKRLMNVHERYENVLATDAWINHCHKINALQDIDSLHQQILSIVQEKLA